MAEEKENGEALSLRAADGYPLGGVVWRHEAGTVPARPVVIINPATSVRCRYYGRFAAYLHARGFDVVIYDYRGIGESRPASLRRLRAGWIEWGRLDFEAVLNHVLTTFPGQPVQVVAHSVGGFLIGLAASNHRISRVFTMGAQFAYWRDYAPQRRTRLLLKWHLVMPALTALFGYFPGQRLGWLEDTPKGVVQDWTAPHPRFENAHRRGPRALPEAERQALVAQFAALRAPILALGVSDDEFATVPAIQRLLRYFHRSPATHLEVAPQDIGREEIGHFAFFHSRFEPTLWPIALAWLAEGTLPATAPGRRVPLGEPEA